MTVLVVMYLKARFTGLSILVLMFALFINASRKKIIETVGIVHKSHAGFEKVINNSYTLSF